MLLIFYCSVCMFFFFSIVIQVVDPFVSSINWVILLKYSNVYLYLVCDGIALLFLFLMSIIFPLCILFTLKNKSTNIYYYQPEG